ncbi:putative male-specific lethal-3 protein-like 2 [Lytechinus pictus]|uniref:putative male-specific lethal-3 protein-like 2 n=1 Tax=Lytechinus pictus TaxID=7653 RepID=UPI0030BA17B2
MRKKRRKRTWSEILQEAREKREKMAKENSASSAEDSSVGSSDSEDEDDDEAVEVPITFPEALHAKLEDDCYFITSKKQLVKLPPEHTALSLMETYVKDFAYRCQAHNVRVHLRQQGTAGMPVSLTTPNSNNGDSVVPPPLPQFNVDLCREVIDGIRILFDFLLPTNLLYDCERAQYNSRYAQRPLDTNGVKDDTAKIKPCTNGNVRATRRWSMSPSKEVLPPVLEPQTAESPPVLKPEAVVDGKKEKQEPAPARRITRRSSSSSFNQSSPPPPPPPTVSSTRELRSSDSQRRRSADIKISSSSANSVMTLTHTKRDEGDATTTTTTTNKELTNHHPPSRSLRHSSRLASSSSSSSFTPSPPVITNMDSIPSLEASSSTPAPQTPQVLSNGDNKDTMKLRGSRGSLSTADVGKIPQTAELSIKEEDNDDGVFSIEKNCWKLLPDGAHYNGAEPPCRVYGAQHLLRLFVKLPEILGRMDLPAKKLKPLVKHLEMFLRWLSATEQLLEYFPDKAYVSEAHALRDRGDSKTKRTVAVK